MAKTGAPTEAQTLAEYAAQTPKLRRCLLCSVDPEIERQAREGKAAGIPYRVIGEWLDTQGHPNATKGRLERHFTEGHML